jgi:thiol-disulfide isomerase/thioredoxin
MMNQRPLSGALFAALLAIAVPSVAQPAVDSVFKDFQRTGDYLLIVDGKPVPSAEIYRNDDLPAYLLLAPTLPAPVLLTPRNMAVETVPLAKIVRQKDGSVALAADAETQPQGEFKLEGDKVIFTSGGRKASLGPNPPLLGLQRSPALKNHSPEYIVGARGYTPNGKVVAALKKEAKPVKVRVFFGSWCPHCKKHLPYLLRVEDELKGSKIQFEYYGLPQRFTSEPEAKRYGVDGVPLAIVYVNGKEAGRIQGDDWNAPETRLSRILSGGSAPSR